MYTHLKEREYYEEFYDKMTVEDARRGMVAYDDFFEKLERKLPKGDTTDRPGNALILNVFYMGVVGNELIRRYEQRSPHIAEWMAKDEAKDEQIASARLKEEPYCHHCSKKGLRIIDKSLMHRKAKYKIGDPEEVLFMLQCPHCNKNSAFWEDGTAWNVKPTLCPKCSTEMTYTKRKTKTAINFKYACPSCQHSYKDNLDISVKEEEKPDPDYEKDRIHFCLLDKEFREKLIEIQRGLKQMAELGKEIKEKENNKEVYDAIKELKKPKIAELATLLSPALERAGYNEFHLDQPEMGKDVFIGFNCLDTKPDRSDYDSRSVLTRLVTRTLEDTNWRLTSDGISYRLGYLSGRLHAYESEEDLKKLVEKNVKNNGVKHREFKADKDARQYILDKDGRNTIL